MPARKGQGQWALGYREPLNPNERSKRDNDGLKVRQRILDIQGVIGGGSLRPVSFAPASTSEAAAYNSQNGKDIFGWVTPMA